MRRLFASGPWAVAAMLFPVVADGVHFFVFDALNERWLRVLNAPGTGAVTLLAGLYALWLVSLVFVGWLEPSSPTPMGEATLREGLRTRKVRFAWPKLLFFYPSLLFGLVCMMAIFQATGGMASAAAAGAVPEGLQDVALGAGLVLFVSHIIIAAVDVRPRFPPGHPAHFGVLVPVVLVGEVMLNLATALFLRAFGPDPAKPEQLASAAARSTSELFLAVMLFVLFFAGPRFTALSRHFTWPSLVSGLALVVWEMHGLLDRLDL